MKAALIYQFETGVNNLIKEINLYPDEESVWVLSGTIANSPGTLCLHLAGNLQHFIGATLGNTGYVRQRDKEFSDRNVPRAILISNLENALSVVKSTLESIEEGVFFQEYPIEVLGKKVRTDFWMLNLVGHLNYHLGQVNYHRRLLAYT
ncbi:MAG: DUF1572 family protein [Chitinophagales bacterium]|nr:DUF1572 family protein [Chitinophagales bacterium]